MERFPTLTDEIAGRPIGELAQEFGTPVFIYDAAKIVERIHDLAAFDTVRYAQKACSSLAILDLVRRHGAVVDAVSAGEIRRAHRVLRAIGMAAMQAQMKAAGAGQGF